MNKNFSASGEDRNGTIFQLTRVNPCPRFTDSGETEATTPGTLISISVASKYEFYDSLGSVYHHYPVPGSAEVQNLAGYVDKLMKYRDPELETYLRRNGLSKEVFLRGDFPILKSRSPKLDILLHRLIRMIQTQRQIQRVSLFDHGCTVAEHYDFLDLMLKVDGEGKGGAAEALNYLGLDRFSSLLHAAQHLHFDAPSEYFQLMQAEGSDFALSPKSFDLALSVGVVNHTHNPKEALAKILEATRVAAVFALWIVDREEDGIWLTNHAGNASYFFSRSDLREVLLRRGEGYFALEEFIPERESSQPDSYVGVSQELYDSLACCHLVYTTLPNLPFASEKLELGITGNE